MAWTYSGDPSDSDRDWVRFRVGDTDSTDPQLTDGEIDSLVSDEGSKEAAALAAVRAILAKYARLVDKSVGDLHLSYSQRQASYQALAERLERLYALRTAIPFAGGISISGKETLEDDTDRVAPFAKRGQFSQPGTDPDDGTDPSGSGRC